MKLTSREAAMLELIEDMVFDIESDLESTDAQALGKRGDGWKQERQDFVDAVKKQIARWKKGRGKQS